MIPPLLLLAAGGAVLLASRMSEAKGAPPNYGGAPASSGGRLCITPPGPQPKAPAGWRRFRGRASSRAVSAAREALSLPLGAFTTFLDEDGVERAVLLEYHCHEPSEGVRPVGWHKGATLFEPDPALAFNGSSELPGKP